MKKGFTLAEVLITLGIIGVVAAITMSALIANHQKKVAKEQFIKSYSLMQQAWKKAEASLGYSPECYYWDSNPYETKCAESVDGVCKKLILIDGSPLPYDYNGKMNECKIFMAQIVKELQIIKTCKGNGVRDGCIPPYEGVDSIRKINDDTLTDDYIASVTGSCANWRKQAIHNERTIYVLKDGSLILLYTGPTLFAVDINGKKGPNKWGHDLFAFRTIGNVSRPLRIQPYGGGCAPVEKGGVSSFKMFFNAYK